MREVPTGLIPAMPGLPQSIFGSSNTIVASLERASSKVHNRGVAGSETRARDQVGRNSLQIDNPCELNVKNVLTEQSTIR